MTDPLDSHPEAGSHRSLLRCRRRFLTEGLAISLLLSLPELALAAVDGKKNKFALAGAPLPAHKPRPPRLVMLDAGHGGKDPGAIGRHGTYEKHVTLDVTQHLADQLSGMTGVTVALTRTDDHFIPLSERVEMARAAKADLFISIHADSAPTPAAHGLSAYTLSEKASDSFAKALAHQENMVDGPDRMDTNDADVAAILRDLTTRHARNASQRARADIVRGIGHSRSWRLLENPMRSANFAVLRAPDIPSVLIETGFLSNARDEAQLATSEKRRHIAWLLSREIDHVLNSSAFV